MSAPSSLPGPVLDRPNRQSVDLNSLSSAPYPPGQADPDSDADGTSTERFALSGGPTGSVLVEVTRPVGVAGPLPVVLFLHGLSRVPAENGARASANGRLMRTFALGTDAAVVLVHYGHGSEAAHPVAVEQCYAVARWLAERGGDIGLDGDRMAVVGDSRGGHLAAALTLLAKERGKVRLVQQVLLCPLTDNGLASASHRSLAKSCLVGRDALRRFWNRYVPDLQRCGPGTASPSQAAPEQLAGLPPALVVTSEADAVRDEAEAYAAQLRAAGVEVVSVRYLGTVHGFMVLDRLRDTASARTALFQTLDIVHRALHSRRDRPR
ncbi:alpha/beta hydrolase [Streptomyces tendae]|uniref:alpha/beta hydrolase n=1 Tax=Streptomyces tendae TaxID=1932 RepID=UPI00371FA337